MINNLQIEDLENVNNNFVFFNFNYNIDNLFYEIFYLYKNFYYNFSFLNFKTLDKKEKIIFK